MKCRRLERGPLITVGYEHIRVAFIRALAKELPSLTLEDIMKNVPTVGGNIEIEDVEFNLLMENNYKFSSLLSKHLFGNPEKNVRKISINCPFVGDCQTDLCLVKQKSPDEMCKDIERQEWNLKVVEYAPS